MAAASPEMVFTLIERPDMPALKWIAANYKELTLEPDEVKASEHLKSINKYIRLYTESGGLMRVNYFKTNNRKEGRMFVEHGVGIQHMPREIRHTICREIYDDIDFVNSHPAILDQYCEQNGIPHTTLHEYVIAREAKLTAIMDYYKSPTKQLSRSDAKELIVKIINGGGMEYAKEYGKDSEEPWIRVFKEDMKAITRHVVERNPGEVEFQLLRIKNREPGAPAKKNIPASVLNMVMCNIENRCLMEMVKFFHTRGFTVGVLCFDGLMIEKHPPATITQELLEQASQAMFEATGYRIPLIVKPMDEGFTLPTSISQIKVQVQDDRIPDILPAVVKTADEIIVYGTTDKEMAKMLFTQISDLVLVSESPPCTKQTTYLYDPRPTFRIWYELTTRDEMIKKIVQIMTFRNITVRKVHKTVDRQVAVKWSETYESERTLIKYMLDHIEPIMDFDKTIINSQIGWLHHHGGAYNFFEDKFYPIDEEPNDLFTTIRAPRTFYRITAEDVEGQALINEVEEKIFTPLFRDDTMKYHFINNLARRMAGINVDKSWMIITGLRNTGKGVIKKLLRMSFGAYIGAFNVNNLASGRKASDPELAAMWFCNCIYNRIIFASEAANEITDTLNGNDIKRFVSGGDLITCREIREKARTVSWNGTLFIAANDCPKVVPRDATQTCNRYDFDTEFVNMDETHHLHNQDSTVFKYAQMDDTIKTKFVIRADVANAFLNLLIRHFTPNCLPKPAAMKLAYDEDETDPHLMMNRIFEYTGVDTDRVKNGDIYEHIDKYGANCLKDMSTHQIAQQLKKLKATTFTWGSPTSRGYIKLKLKFPTK